MLLFENIDNKSSVSLSLSIYREARQLNYAYYAGSVRII